MSLRTITSYLFLATIAVVLSGCAGYQKGDIKPTQYQGIDKLYVPLFENDVLEPRLAALVTNAVVSQLHLDGTYQITDQAEADAELRGSIHRIFRNQQRSANNQVLETRELLTMMEVRWELRDAKTGALIQQENPFGIDADEVDSFGQRRRSGGVWGRTTVFLDDNFQLSENQALERAASDAAQQLVSDLSEGW